jgi:hypothetical protein
MVVCSLFPFYFSLPCPALLNKTLLNLKTGVGGEDLKMFIFHTHLISYYEI